MTQAWLTVYLFAGETAPERVYALFSSLEKAQKHAVNAILGAVHDNMFEHQPEANHLLQEAFTILSRGSVSFAQRLREGRELWQEFLNVVDDNAVVRTSGQSLGGGLSHPDILLDSYVYPEILQVQ